MIEDEDDPLASFLCKNLIDDVVTFAELARLTFALSCGEIS